MNVLDILISYHQGFAAGLRVTLELAVSTWAIGIAIGILLGIAGHRWRKSLGAGLWFFAFLLSGIPLLVLLYWVHYPLQTLLDIVVDPFYSALALLVLINTIGVGEVVRAALDDFPSEYLLAAQACGMTSRETVLRIQLPLILRRTLPSLLSLQISMLQMTLFASLISVEEIFRVAQRINSAIHRPVEIYTALAVFFLAVCLPINGLALWLKAKYTRDLSER